MRVALLLLLILAPDVRALRLYEKTQFQKVEAQDDAARRVMDVLLNKEHWVGAFSAIAEKYVQFPDDLNLTVDFDYEGEEMARALCSKTKSRISFNLKKLAAARKKLDEDEKAVKAGQARGERFVWKVPPAKIERMIYHEVTHVLQQGYDGPRWFIEGMAQLMGDDPNSICAFATEGKAVKDIDVAVGSINDIYARGHLFWKWLESRYAARKAFELTFVERRPWKESLEEATNQSWSSILAAEREWSEKQVEKLR